MAFCLGLGGCSLVAAAWITNRDTDARQGDIARVRLFGMNTNVRGINADLANSRLRDLIKRARRFVAAFPAGSQLPTIAAEWWINQTEAQRTCLGLIGLQIVVYLFWQLPFPAAQRFSTRFLWHDPLAGRPITLLTSIFSHRGLLHLGFNSIALYSIGSSSYAWLSFPANVGGSDLPRSTSRYEFVALFVAAGLFSSLTSHLWSIRVLLRRALRQATYNPLLPSLGASGALYGCLSVTALAYPDASVALIFLPFVPIPIGTAYWGMVLIDVVGLFRGWRMFDHAAHLGGALFGLAYFTIGHQYFERCRLYLKGLTKQKA